MSDFVIQFGHPQRVEHIVKQLRDRPGLESRCVQVEQFAWGRVILQLPRSKELIPWRDNTRLLACVGRPRLIGDNILHDEQYLSRLALKWPNSDPSRLLDELTGLFALLACNDKIIEIITDPLGAQPVYTAHAPSGKLVGMGTDVESLAVLSERGTDFDQVSVAELLVYNNVTFPFSTRHGIQEVSPGAHIQIGSLDGAPSYTESVYFSPSEPATEVPNRQLMQSTVEAIQSAAADITKGVDTVAVTLSGGLDSRVVLAALPASLERTAVTYATHENLETETAQLVAQAAGATHMFAWRSEDYFSDLLLNRGPRLLGMERRAATHGMCIIDNQLDERFDVVLGGQLSDTLFKGHYQPWKQQIRLQSNGPLQRGKNLAKCVLGRSTRHHPPSATSTIGRFQLERELLPHVRAEVRNRRRQRVLEVQKLRPTTAEEWARFWPISRQDDIAHVLGNAKLFPFESLFLHRSLIRTAMDYTPSQRLNGWLANQAYSQVFGRLGTIVNANTGRPARSYQARRPARSSVQDRSIEGAGVRPWNRVQHSWVDNVLMQKLDPAWQDVRQRLASSPVLDVFAEILRRSPKALVQEYDEELPGSMNQMYIQLAMQMDRLLHQ
ncbi:asparagine synthase-related protein [Aeoliella sp.]|uniref:asparagine synthase-related protein n=1 Tax=Aeoliella sp. TaxID=2795800 RepID=UPI003CCBBB73